MTEEDKNLFIDLLRKLKTKEDRDKLISSVTQDELREILYKIKKKREMS